MLETVSQVEAEEAPVPADGVLGEIRGRRVDRALVGLSKVRVVEDDDCLSMSAIRPVLAPRIRFHCSVLNLDLCA